MTPKKSSRRTNGEGSIFYRTERDRWEGRKTISTSPDGKPIRKTVTGRTRSEVVKRMQEITRVGRIPDLPISPTLTEWVDYWLTHIRGSQETKESTRQWNFQVMKNYVLPQIGKIKIDRLLTHHVRAMVSALDQKGLSAQTQKGALKCLRHCLNDAIRSGLLVTNFAGALFVKSPSVDIGRVRALSQLEAKQLLAHIERPQFYRYRAIIHLLISRGLRRGEVLALSWDDFNFETRMLTVHRSLTRIALRNESGVVAPFADGVMKSELRLGTPKTRKSSRTIEIPHQVAKILQEHKQFQEAEQQDFLGKYGGKWAAEKLIFTTALGTPLDPDNFRAMFRKIAIDAGLGHRTVHEMRHTCASLMIKAGVQPKEIQELLGHESIKVTLDFYGHLFPESRSITSDAATKLLYK